MIRRTSRPFLFGRAQEAHVAERISLSVDLDGLTNLYYVRLADGVSSLESYETDDLRVLDDELEQGVQGLYSDENDGIVAFLLSKGTFTEEQADSWIKSAEDEAINMSIKTALAAAMDPEPSFAEIEGLIERALDEDGLTLDDGSPRWPWLIEVFAEYCIILMGGRYFKLEYVLNDDGTVTFGSISEVRHTWTPAPASASVEGVEPRQFAMRLGDVPEGFESGVDDDGLIWKEMFHVSTTYRMDGSPLKVDQAMIDALADSYQASVMDMVPVTSADHFDEVYGIVPVRDTDGEVAAVVKVGGSLYGGLRIPDEDTRAKLEQGLVKSCSIYAWPNYVDRRDGEVWPWVLAHLLLTNYAQIPDLKPFGEGPDTLAASAVGGAKRIITYVEETLMGDKENTNQAPQATLSPEDQAALAELRELKASGFSVAGLREQQAALQAQARTLEVGSIVASLEGRQERADVTNIDGYRHYPAVIAAAEKMLQGGEGFSVDVDQAGKSTVDQVVLGVLNALPQEARLKLDAAPQRPDRSGDQDAPPPRTKFSTEPLPPGEAARVSDEAIDNLTSRIKK